MAKKNQKEADNLAESLGIIQFTPLDLVPVEVTPDSLFHYLVDSGWIAGLVGSKAHHNGFDDEQTVEIYHEILLLIYDKREKLYEVYERDGLVQSLGYAKVIAVIQSGKAGVWKQKIEQRLETISMTSDMMAGIEKTYDPEKDDVYHLSDTMPEYDHDINLI